MLFIIIDLIKLAYCIKQIYNKTTKKINSVFKFSSNKEELNEFISTK